MLEGVDGIVPIFMYVSLLYPTSSHFQDPRKCDPPHFCLPLCPTTLRVNFHSSRSALTLSHPSELWMDLIKHVMASSKSALDASGVIWRAKKYLEPEYHEEFVLKYSIYRSSNESAPAVSYAERNYSEGDVSGSE